MAHITAFTRMNGYDPHHLHCAEGFPNRSSDNIKLISQISFRQHPITRLQFSFFDGKLNLMNYFLIDLFRLHWSKHYSPQLKISHFHKLCYCQKCFFNIYWHPCRQDTSSSIEIFTNQTIGIINSLRFMDNFQPAFQLSLTHRTG
ncbi:hypothetical protein SDC9_158538 [bioreactor metagenome]|uniref:Uncharacterized protein n=1 Tax=bioreactor metagenome TaxID=1076179 RepID=A0A645FAF6_9ZZZZ